MKEISPATHPIPVPKQLAPRSIMTPDTANGCSPQVTFGNQTCISVYGTGLEVIYWTTGVNLKSPPSSPSALYLVSGAVREVNDFPGTDASGFQWDPFGYQSTYLFYINGTPEPLIFGNNTKVCNEWNGAAIHTEPCETVHA